MLNYEAILQARLFSGPWEQNPTQPTDPNAETAETPLKLPTASKQSISSSLSFIIVGALFSSGY